MTPGIYSMEVFSNEAIDSYSALFFKVWDKSQEIEIELTEKEFYPQDVFQAFPASQYNPPQWTSNNDQWGLNIYIKKEIYLHDFFINVMIVHFII